jgi:outer membrane protein
MRVTRVAVVILLGALLLTSQSGAAQRFENVPEAKPADQAAPAAGLKIGVINFQAAMGNTQEGRKALQDLETQFAPRRAELEKVQRELNDLQNQLRTQGNTLSDEARVQLIRQGEQKRKLAQRLSQDIQDDAQDAQEELVNRLGTKLKRIIDLYGADKGFHLILDYSQSNAVAFFAPATDVTDEVVRLYDQAYPVQAAQPAQPSAPRPAAPRPNPPPK